MTHHIPFAQMDSSQQAQRMLWEEVASLAWGNMSSEEFLRVEFLRECEEEFIITRKQPDFKLQPLTCIQE